MSALPGALRSLAQQAAQNPALGAFVGTGTFCVVYSWYTNVTIRKQLMSTQRSYLSVVEDGFKDCRETLKQMDQTWAKDLKSRDNSARSLELQNVEQTRSIARLDSAMKKCGVTTVPSPQAP